MENTERKVRRRVSPRRKLYRKIRRLARKYAPLVIIALILILFISFAVGSVKRGDQRREEQRQESLAAQQAQQQQQILWNQEVTELLYKAEALAAAYDYDGAIDMLDTFSGNMEDYNALMVTRDRYVQTKESMVPWNNPSQIPNLSFHMLIAEAYRTFNNAGYGKSWKWNFVTTTEFSKILQQLYDNGYVLVDMDDVIVANKTAEGITYEVNTLYLPEGKKPIMLTQTQVNYYGYMVDGNDDGTPDKEGAGFAHRLILDANGNLTCEMVDRSGNTVTGAYDMVPILNTFLKAHPDFSYHGAKAIVAVSGYDGIFGYRGKELAQAKPIVEALRRDGYTIACYTYGNLAYGSASAKRVQEDLGRWNAEIAPLLDKVDVLVYAKNSDLDSYSGEKFEALTKAGFRFFLGMCDNHESWLQMNSTYVRQGRILVNGANLANNTYFYKGLFDPTTMEDPSR